MSSPLDSVAGRPADLFTESVPEDLLCPICMGVFNNAVVMPCQHSFCAGCIRMHLKKNELRPSLCCCPVCREPLSSQECGRNVKFAAAMISRLVTYCDHYLVDCLMLVDGDHVSSSTCSWTGRMDELQNHLEKQCMAHPLPCPNVCCSSRLLRADLEHHVAAECEFRRTTCSMCSASVLLTEEAEHMAETCPEGLVDCVKGCSSKVKRCDVVRHATLDCDRVDVACPYESVGCLHTGPRSEMMAHLTSELFANNHAVLTKQAVAEFKSEIEDEKRQKQHIAQQLVLDAPGGVQNGQNFAFVISCSAEEMIGHRVIAGRDFKWNDQAFGTGVVKSMNLLPGWVKVEWANGAVFNYRHGVSVQGCPRYDLFFADLDASRRTILSRRQAAAAAAGDSALVNSPSNPSQPPPAPLRLAQETLLQSKYPPMESTLHKFVIRSKDWKWNDEDGGSDPVQSVGRVVGHNFPWISVQWVLNRNVCSYRYGLEEDGAPKFDVEVLSEDRQGELKARWASAKRARQ